MPRNCKIPLSTAFSPMCTLRIFVLSLLWRNIEQRVKLFSPFAYPIYIYISIVTLTSACYETIWRDSWQEANVTSPRKFPTSVPNFSRYPRVNFAAWLATDENERSFNTASMRINGRNNRMENNLPWKILRTVACLPNQLEILSYG